MKEKMSLQFISEMYSDAGVWRRTNQDACCVRMMNIGGHSIVLAAVCDGAGGMQEGDYASKSTIQFFNNWFDYTASKNIQGKDQEELIRYFREEIEQCIQKQNRLVYEYAQGKGIRTGTTLTLLLIADRKYITAQVGDSRAYLIGQGLQQLTEDQSVVAREVRAGRLSPREAKYDKRRNVILQCIGASKNLQVVYESGTVGGGDIFFLCSDGFVHELENDEIEEFLRLESLVDQASVKKCLMDAVSLVRERGEKDNITIVLVKVYEDLWTNEGDGS